MSVKVLRNRFLADSPIVGLQFTERASNGALVETGRRIAGTTVGRCAALACSPTRRSELQAMEAREARGG